MSNSARVNRIAEAAAAYTACVDLMQIIALHPDKLVRAIKTFGEAREALAELAEAATPGADGHDRPA